MKSALKSGGLTIGNMSGEYLVYCARWGVCIGSIYASNKFKAAIMELIGDLPEEGECYRYSLSPEKEIEQERVFNIPVPFEDWKAAKDTAAATPLCLTAWPHEYMVFQRRSDRGFLAADRSLTGKVISPAELDASVESMPGRPSVLGGTVLYYKNDTAIYWVHGESCGERAETVLFPRLEGIDFFESSWIRREGLETNKQADGDMGEPLPY